jgi:phosphatidylcholine synthase
MKTVLAWGVHVYTASGAVIGFLALLSAFEGDYRWTFALLSLALLIDSTDGAMARACDVKHVVPWFDGELLDNIVDYFTYVIVPVAVFVQPGILPPELKYAALLVLLASAYGFSRTDAKGLVERYFQGFPSYWNVIAFYFVVLRTPPMLNVIVLLVFIALVFAPMRWLYPSRMDEWRKRTIALGAVWSLMGVYMIARLPEASPVVGMISLFYPVYYTGASMLFHSRS